MVGKFLYRGESVFQFFPTKNRGMFAPLKIRTPNPTPDIPEYSSEEALKYAYGYNDASANNIGRGGFGQVKKVAIDSKQYAVKRVRINTISKFMKEVKNHEFLSTNENTSKYVPTYIGYVIMNGYGYIIQSYVHSMDFMRFIELERSFTKETGTKIYNELINAVNAMHSINYVHNDIKPENILLVLDNSDRPTGQVLLIDFDTMCKLPCQSLNRVGTNLYWPNFVISNSSLRIPYNIPTEKYSLGIVLSEIANRTEGIHSNIKTEIEKNYLQPGYNEYTRRKTFKNSQNNQNSVIGKKNREIKNNDNNTNMPSAKKTKRRRKNRSH